MLFECTISHLEGEKQYLVEATNYAEAETTFNQYAHNNIAGDYELIGISRSNSKLSIANDSKVVNAVDNTQSTRRIGFNPTNKVGNTTSEKSPITIYF